MNKESKKTEDLEERVWYRFSKVLYGMGWATVVAITLFTFIATKPTGAINYSQSTIKCPNSFEYVPALTGYYTASDKSLNVEDHLQALKNCSLDKTRIGVIRKETGETGTVEVWDFDPSLFQIIDTTPPYTINWVSYQTWESCVRWTAIVLVASSFLLVLLKSALLYVLLGKFDLKPF